MLRSSLALALPLLVVAVAQAGGCGSGSGSSADACGTYFDALSRCIPQLGAGLDVAHYRARYELLCQQAIALPGSSFTADQVSACAGAVKDLDCGAVMTAPECKLKPGDLDDGAPCASPVQCKSTVCVLTGSSMGDAGTSFCGTCQPAIAAGQPCGGSQVTQCVQGTECDGTGGTLTCTPVTYGAAGASCGSASKRCNPGLYCEPSMLICTPQKAAGAACATTQECTSGLVCDSTSKACVMPTVAAPGKPCGGAVTCQTGYCPATGTCPTIIADGQPCDPMNKSASCDLFSYCTQGICKLYVADTCK